jgi:hypothetical protein
MNKQNFNVKQAINAQKNLINRFRLSRASSQNFIKQDNKNEPLF